MRTVADRIEEAKAFGVWLHQRTNDVEMRNLDRDRVALAMFQHSLDLVDGTLVLLDNNLPGPALALGRPFVEAYVRGVWALYCANDDELDGFWTKGRPDPWGLKRLTALLEERELDQSKWVRTVVAETAELNDLVHGGGLHLRGRIVDDRSVPVVAAALLARGAAQPDRVHNASNLDRGISPWNARPKPQPSAAYWSPLPDPEPKSTQEWRHAVSDTGWRYRRC